MTGTHPNRLRTGQADEEEERGLSIMGLRQHYLTAVARRVETSSARSWSPVLLAQACVDVLPVDGAGVSLSQKMLRVPLGWSSPAVEVAERAQTTLGSGPCLAAAAAGHALAADASTIAERWPVYWDEIQQRTPFRSVVSVPLRIDDRPILGALDLYAESTVLAPQLTLAEVGDAVAGPIAVLLSGAFDRVYDEDPDIPDWFDDDPAVGRMTVWTAVGMIVSACGGTDTDALATLRAWAYSHARTLDDVAESVVDRRLPVRALVTAP